MENKTEKKMTYVTAINFVLEKYGEELPNEVIEKFNKMKEQFNKKKSVVSAKKLEEQQELKNALYNVIKNSDKSLKASEIARILGSETTPQKVTPYLKQMVNAGELECDKIKNTNFYSLPVEIED